MFDDRTEKRLVGGEYLLHQGDNLQILAGLPEESVDMIFADPPYNMQTDGELLRVEGTVFKGVNDKWDKYGSYGEFLQYTEAWILECRRILKKNGSLWVIGSFHNIYNTGHILLTNGFWVLNDIVWEKSNPVPNMKGTRFCNAHETLLRCVKDKNAKATFNYKTMKHLNGGKQMKSVWNIPLCTGKERLTDADGGKLHNTQKPLKLLEYVILSSTKKGDTVLDPFSGTGTTGVASLKFLRKYIGIEREERYLTASKNRLDNVEISQHTDLIENTYDIPLEKVAIEKMLEKGYLTAGQPLYNKIGKLQARLTAKGSVLCAETNEESSIHRLSAKILQKSTNNGWDYWFVELGGEFVSIDSLRQEYREREL
ncbi:MAG: site-specific DNA-methyltransferase [Turicibacter sp.]|nr:site-specific DNA-methyltransferase [Turicibacter sp.]